jgi:hypothetical protein
MQNFYLSVWTGVISGVFVTAISFIFYKIFNNIIKPAYIKFVYEGINISGTWRGGFSIQHGGNNDQEIKNVFDIKQTAFSIKGVFFAETIYKNDRSKDYSNQYEFTGKIVNNMIIMNYRAISDKRTGVGTLMMKPVNGGKILKGHIIHSEDIYSIWSNHDLEIKRD